MKYVIIISLIINNLCLYAADSKLLKVGMDNNNGLYLQLPAHTIEVGKAKYTTIIKLQKPAEIDGKLYQQTESLVGFDYEERFYIIYYIKYKDAKGNVVKQIDIPNPKVQNAEDNSSMLLYLDASKKDADEFTQQLEKLFGEAEDAYTIEDYTQAKNLYTQINELCNNIKIGKSVLAIEEQAANFATHISNRLAVCNGGAPALISNKISTYYIPKIQQINNWCNELMVDEAQKTIAQLKNDLEEEGEDAEDKYADIFNELQAIQNKLPSIISLKKEYTNSIDKANAATDDVIKLANLQTAYKLYPSKAVQQQIQSLQESAKEKENNELLNSLNTQIDAINESIVNNTKLVNNKLGSFTHLQTLYNDLVSDASSKWIAIDKQIQAKSINEQNKAMELLVEEKLNFSLVQNKILIADDTLLKQWNDKKLNHASFLQVLE
jgi:hypothetical protein